MSSTRVIVRLIRFCPVPFILNTTYALLVYFVGPIILGLATQATFNDLTGNRHFADWVDIGVLTAILVGQAAAGPLLRSPWSLLQLKAMVLLRANTFAGVLQGYGRHGLPIPPGEAVSRLRDDPPLICDALDAVSDLIGRSCFALGSAALMWHISPVITLTIFVPLILCSALVEVLESRIVAYRNAARAAGGTVNAFLGDLLRGQLAVNVAGAGANSVARLNHLGNQRREAEVRDAVFGGLLDAFNTNLGSLGVAVVLLLGAHAIRSGAFSIGDLALFAVFLDSLGWYPAEIGRLLGDLKRIEVSMDRLVAVAPATSRADLVNSRTVYLGSEVVPATTPVAHAPEAMPTVEPLHRLEVRGLTYDHPGVAHGISDISFTLERGTFTVVTGRIGSGKSTLLNVLLGLLPFDRGEIRWNGELIRDPGGFFVPPRSAYTPQVPHLFSETVRENLLLGGSASEADVESAIHAAVLERDLAELEHGLDTLVGPRGVKLSGGQVQRVAAARMFLRNASLIVFDDLSSALDAETEAELWSRIFTGTRDQTFLVVSHRPAALTRADQILLLEAGKLVDSGR